MLESLVNYMAAVADRWIDRKRFPRPKGLLIADIDRSLLVKGTEDREFFDFLPELYGLGWMLAPATTGGLTDEDRFRPLLLAVQQEQADHFPNIPPVAALNGGAELCFIDPNGRLEGVKGYTRGLSNSALSVLLNVIAHQSLKESEVAIKAVSWCSSLAEGHYRRDLNGSKRKVWAINDDEAEEIIYNGGKATNVDVMSYWDRFQDFDEDKTNTFLRWGNFLSRGFPWKNFAEYYAAMLPFSRNIGNFNTLNVSQDRNLYLQRVYTLAQVLAQTNFPGVWGSQNAGGMTIYPGRGFKTSLFKRAHVDFRYIREEARGDEGKTVPCFHMRSALANKAGNIIRYLKRYGIEEYSFLGDRPAKITGEKEVIVPAVDWDFVMYGANYGIPVMLRTPENPGNMDDMLLRMMVERAHIPPNLRDQTPSRCDQYPGLPKNVDAFLGEQSVFAYGMSHSHVVTKLEQVIGFIQQYCQ